ncbi:hypothetical protein L0E83_02570 [Marichromatium gracile]|uniref:hypothetical protein n=1 Tax=Marichromatium gracile TaxID=1048 RepID=UPI001F362BDA|nr:hypothetical protein [Marichromatium gracile]MCF1182318.1 hypothetical protein [Marichromatium gracile]
MRIQLSLLFVAVALLSGGCGAPHLRQVHEAEQRLLGAEVERLAHCIGEPLSVTRPATEPGVTLRHYSSAQRRGADGLLRATPVPDPEDNARACVFDIRVRDGRVVAIASDNRAGWGFGSIKRCSAVIGRCAGG